MLLCTIGTRYSKTQAAIYKVFAVLNFSVVLNTLFGLPGFYLENLFWGGEALNNEYGLYMGGLAQYQNALLSMNELSK